MTRGVRASGERERERERWGKLRVANQKVDQVSWQRQLKIWVKGLIVDHYNEDDWSSCPCSTTAFTYCAKILSPNVSPVGKTPSRKPKCPPHLVITIAQYWLALIRSVGKSSQQKTAVQRRKNSWIGGVIRQMFVHLIFQKHSLIYHIHLQAWRNCFYHTAVLCGCNVYR